MYPHKSHMLKIFSNIIYFNTAWGSKIKVVVFASPFHHFSTNIDLIYFAQLSYTNQLFLTID